MESLPKDVAIEIALNLSPADLIRFCSASKAQNRICNSNDFWRRKLNKDYPETKDKIIEYPREVYIYKFTYAKSFPYKFSKYLTDQYRKDLYFSLNLIYEMVKNNKDKEDEYTYVVEQLDDLIPLEILQSEEDESLVSQILSRIHKIVSNQI